MLQPIPTLFVLIAIAVLLHIFGESLGGAKLAPLRLLIVVVILLACLWIVLGLIGLV